MTEDGNQLQQIQTRMKGVSASLYPFASHYVTIGGHQYHYVEEGKGMPVVMVHGNPTWSFYYRELIQKLSLRFHCLAPDHIGCGYSDKPGDATYSYTLEQRVKDLETFLEIKGITQNISFPFKAENKDGGILLTGEFTINRKDFNVGGSSAVLGNSVNVNLKVFAN